MSIPRVFILLVLISTGCSNSKATGTDRGTVRGGAESVSTIDRQFIADAVVSGQREVEQSTLAQRKASNLAVKEFAADLNSAHMAANQELNAWIARKGLRVTDGDPSRRPDRRGSVGSKDDATTATKMGGQPTGSPNATGTTGASGSVATTGEALDRQRAGTMYPWMQAAGSEFDLGFLAEQIKSHQDAIALFQQESTIGADPELKAFATKHLAAARQHLQQAEELQRAIAHQK